MRNLQPKYIVRKLAGVSLVEIMIAMLLGLVLMGGMLQVFASSRQSYRVHDAVSRMQESGRMALEVVSRDSRMADFWGCLDDGVKVVNNLNTAGTGYVDFGDGGVSGTEGTAGAPDTLVVRGSTSSGIGLRPGYGPLTSARVKVPVGNGFEKNDIVLVSDCESADVFQITNNDPDGSGRLVHKTNGAAPGNINVTDPGCAGTNAHCLSKVYGPDASVFQVEEIVFNVATGSEGQPALFRNGQEFLDGVEDFQVIYGEDTDGDNVANYYVPASQVVDMDDVISIRFAVVTRSYDDNLTGGLAQTYNVLGTDVTATDGRLRQVYTTTVTVRNRL